MPIICKLPIKNGADVKNVTATPDKVLLGEIFVDSTKKQSTGTMPNNNAITKTLGVNETYTIPKGYHNGNGTVSQSLITKSAQTYTPNDTTQTISSNQYLTGVQTISPVSTETKTITAGTSATTVNRTSGKYMTSVTVNPTPSQTKTVTMTSSPMTVYPDNGSLLSSVTVNANFGRKYASGTNSSESYNYTCFRKDMLDGSNLGNFSFAFLVDTGVNWTPSCAKATVYNPSDGVYYTYMAQKNSYYCLIQNPTGNGNTSLVVYFTPSSGGNIIYPLSGSTIIVPSPSNAGCSLVSWEIWE